MSRQAGKAPSQRQLRVGEAIRHELADQLGRGETHDPRLEGVSLTVAEVRVSPDLRQATVFVSELGRKLTTEVAEALGEAAPALRGHLARSLHLRFAPQIRFVADPSFDEADRISQLLAEARRASPPPADEDDDHGEA
ncbi:30S ribosome-binding factor RbfA [Marinivivus vitaminiproducens]|uniref:30S ribosome-binding factor RbfA n=1 Tax=Marinivivus vitaminiproducens TaxID=3035935 RepID=UPI0027A0C7C7|nr:30S ribosome-binding factor RbfA [Geminicoccaceae bacterium SCSIO 64248]